jgi:type IV secretory pathway TraG/TraD family ATPase VirD4
MNSPASRSLRSCARWPPEPAQLHRRAGALDRARRPALKFDAYAPKIFMEGGGIAASGGIAAMGILLGPDGVALGRLGGSYLRHDGPEHVLCFAPTRPGKGAGLVSPTLLTWPYSTIVHDIKGENFQLTAGGRARFGSVLVFDPTNPASAAYNPFLRSVKATARYETRKISPTSSLTPKERSSAAYDNRAHTS